MRFSGVLTVVLLLLTALMHCSVLMSCSGRHEIEPNAPPSQQSPTDAAHTLDVAAQLAELEALPAPAGAAGAQGISAADWAALKGALAAYLTQHHPDGKIAAAAPVSVSAKARLAFDGVDQLSWRYSVAGDYDQNGEVNVSDLTPLGQHFAELSNGGPFPYESALSIVDGDNNGEINIADITPIGASFGARASAYNVYVSTDAGDFPAGNGDASTLEPLGSVLLADATGAPGTDRQAFSFALEGAQDPAAIYWVRPTDGTLEGTPSNMAGPGAPIQSSIALHQLSFEYLDGTVVEDTDWGEVGVTFIGVPELLYFNMTYNGTAVITDMPLVSDRGNGVEHTTFISFSLGVPSGTPVADALVSYTLETTPKGVSQGRHASAETSLSVTSKTNWTVLASGDNEELWDTPPVIASDVYANGAGPVYDTAQHQQNFMATITLPEQRIADHVPASVSSSLRYLAHRFLLPIDTPEKPVDLPTMLTACGSLSSQIAPGVRAGVPLNWPELKDKFMRDNGYPIITQATRSVDLAFEALRDDYDVELVVDFPGATPQEHGQSVYALTAMSRHNTGAVTLNTVEYRREGESVFPVSCTIQVYRDQAIGFNPTGQSTYWGEGSCYYVIEKPGVHDPPGWQEQEGPHFGGDRFGAYIDDEDGPLYSANYNYFTGTYNAGPLRFPFLMMDPQTELVDSAGFTANLATCAINGTQAVLAVVDQPEALSLQYFHFGQDGSVAGPVVLASDPAGDPPVFLGDFGLWMGVVDGVPAVAFNQNSTVMVCEGLDMNGTSFTTPVSITGSFVDGELQCDLGQNNSLLSWESGDDVTLLSDVDFATGIGQNEQVIGTDLFLFDLVWDEAKQEFALVTAGTNSGVKFVTSTDGTGFNFNPNVIVLPGPLSVEMMLGLGPAKDNGLGIALINPAVDKLEFYYGENIPPLTSWSTAEIVADIPEPYYHWDIVTLFHKLHKIQVILAMSEDKSKQKVHYCCYPDGE